MSNDRDLRYLTYIKTSIELIEERARGKSYERFLEDVDMQDSILWRLQTLGEATGRLSEDVKNRHPRVRWRAIYGFRNIAAHGYIELNLDLIWEIVNLHLEELKIVVTEEMSRFEDSVNPEEA